MYIAQAIIAGFIAGFKAAERKKQYGRIQRFHRVRDSEEKQHRLTIQGIRHSHYHGEKDSSVE